MNYYCLFCSKKKALKKKARRLRLLHLQRFCMNYYCLFCSKKKALKKKARRLRLLHLQRFCMNYYCLFYTKKKALKKKSRRLRLVKPFYCNVSEHIVHILNMHHRPECIMSQILWFLHYCMHLILFQADI